MATSSTTFESLSSDLPFVSASASEATSVTVSLTTSAAASASPSADACYVTAYAAIPAAVAACTSITLDGITVPGNSTIDLLKLKTGAKVTFAGTTFWQYADANYPLIKVGGTDLEITAADGAVLDGNGQSWWDGLGSNGGIAKSVLLNKFQGTTAVRDYILTLRQDRIISLSSPRSLDQAQFTTYTFRTILSIASALVVALDSTYTISR